MFLIITPNCSFPDKLPTGIIFEDKFILQPGVYIPQDLWRLSAQPGMLFATIKTRLGSEIICLQHCLFEERFKCKTVIFSTSLYHDTHSYCVWLNDTLATLGRYDYPVENTEYDLFTVIEDCKYRLLIQSVSFTRIVHRSIGQEPEYKQASETQLIGMAIIPCNQ